MPSFSQWHAHRIGSQQAAATALKTGSAKQALSLLHASGLNRLHDSESILERLLGPLWPAAEKGQLGCVPEVAASAYLPDRFGTHPSQEHHEDDPASLLRIAPVFHAERRLCAFERRKTLPEPTPIDRVVWAIDVLQTLFERVGVSVNRTSTPIATPLSDAETLAWWHNVLKAPPTDLRDGGQLTEPWKANLSAGLCNESGARSHQRQGVAHAEFLQGVMMSATLELPSIAAQAITFSHALRPTRLFKLLQEDGTWKAFVTRAAKIPSFENCKSALGVSSRNHLLDRFRQDLEHAGPQAAMGWCHLSLAQSVVQALTRTENRLGTQQALVLQCNRLSARHTWATSPHDAGAELALPIGWGHARNNLFRKLQRCVPMLATQPEKLSAGLSEIDRIAEVTAHAFRYYGHRWMSDQKEEMPAFAFEDGGEGTSAFSDDIDFADEADTFASSAMATGMGAWAHKRVYGSFRLSEKPVLGYPSVPDLHTAPVAHVLNPSLPIDEQADLWAFFQSATLLLLLKGGVTGLVPWATGEKLTGPVRTRLDRWRGDAFADGRLSDNPEVNVQNRRYDRLQAAICRKQQALEQMWQAAARAIVDARPTNRNELVTALSPWLTLEDVIPGKMKWGLCLKNASLYLEQS